ncbi:carbohydrate sulfotransferase 15-like isoform X2 [Amphiura filiformis]|uniref:carbohydrate sulfotransferase 15-like isoform X2 n=1 Tax=Amphiura filiformis TaxID=82378 RepID=UPI003B21C2AF
MVRLRTLCRHLTGTVCCIIFIIFIRTHQDSTSKIVDKQVTTTSKSHFSTRLEKYTIFQELNGPRQKTFKNPCHCMFWQKSDSGCFYTGCLPYFYLIGAPKSATSALWNQLIAHPDIVDIGKETHWWTRSAKTGLEVRNYLFRHSRPLLTLRDNSGINRERQFIIGDGSVSTLWDNSMIINQTYRTTHRFALPFTWADVIYEVQPDAKIIAILRNPVTRLISDYLSFDAYHSAQDFHEGIINATKTFHECLQKMDLRFCANLMYRPRIQIGIYAVHVEEWLRVFPAHQVLILRTEDWISTQPSQRREILKDVFEFLKIEQYPNAQIPAAEINQRMADITTTFQIWTSSIKLLNEFYKPYNKRLSNLLHDSRYLWQD